MEPPSTEPEQGSSSGSPEPAGNCRMADEANLLCQSFQSVSGKDADSELDWLATAPIKIQFDKHGADTVLVLVGPCAPVNALVTMTNGTMTADMPAAIYGASGCVPGAEAEHQTWTENFLKEPVKYSVDEQGLIWTNSQGSVSFAVSDRP